jgi:hypothetical protein
VRKENKNIIREQSYKHKLRVKATQREEMDVD